MPKRTNTKKNQNNKKRRKPKRTYKEELGEIKKDNFSPLKKGLMM